MTRATFLVLTVEDDADIRGVLRTLLEAQSYRVVAAENATRGTIEARAHRPDLALVDLGLPDREGVSLIREIRSFSSTPILVLSARTMQPDKIAALDAGADDFVTKLFSAPELRARVRAALRRTARGGTPLPEFRLREIWIELARRTARGPLGNAASDATGIQGARVPGAMPA